MPEWAISPYVQMLNRLEVGRTRELINVLLYTRGREMRDEERRDYARSLEELSGERRPKAPPLTLASAARFGIQMKGGGET